MLYNVFMWFLDEENIGLDPQMMIPCEVISDIGNLRFWGGHFEKWPKIIVSPSFFSGNIGNMIPQGPLNKMVPLIEDRGGGGGGGGSMGTPVSSRTKTVE